ncbi:MAG TPA: PRC-barrel domain-containing protein [Pyrinomonadaceae bacterium]|nr:PRC-barrel domain-containing protein [Pyrinomonadaceae bacterium]
MSDLRDVAPTSSLTGMTVVSLASGNDLGRITDLFVDPSSGVLLGVTLSMLDGRAGEIPNVEIYNIGRDAVMVRALESIAPPEAGVLDRGQSASKLIGTKIITESGDVLGHITNVFVTLKPPPHILYEARQSLLDKLLGREFFIPASVGHALSDDYARLVVPDVTTELAASDLASLIEQRIEVRTFDAGAERQSTDNDDTILVSVDEDATLVRFDEDETVVRFDDEDETVVRIGDDDDTVLRQRSPHSDQ